MTTCLRKSCSFGLLCVSFMNVDQFVFVLLILLLWGWDVGFDLLTPDHCLSFNFFRLPILVE